MPSKNLTNLFLKPVIIYLFFLFYIFFNILLMHMFPTAWVLHELAYDISTTCNISNSACNSSTRRAAAVSMRSCHLRCDVTSGLFNKSVTGSVVWKCQYCVWVHKRHGVWTSVGCIKFVGYIFFWNIYMTKCWKETDWTSVQILVSFST